MRGSVILPAISLVLTASLFTNGLSQIEFVEHTIDSNTHGTGGIYACDIDGDDDIDVLGASLEDNRIIYWSNSGTEPIVWTRHIIGSNVGSAHSVYAADISMNDTLDVIGAAYSGSPGIAWWRNQGNDPISWTKFAVASNFRNAHEIYAHDLDQDEDIDILGASSDLNTISWWRNERGNPIAWTEQIISDNVTLAKSVHVGDFDGDDDYDVVGAAITAHDILWWRNDGGDPIEWTEFLIDGHFLGAHRVQAIDLDKDGDDDVLCAGYLGHQVGWWRNDGGDPVVWTRQIIGTSLINACVAFAADLDGDSDIDVVVTAQGIDQISWWENDGEDSIGWTKHVITDDFVRPWPLYVCDLDGDLDVDVISGSSHQGSNEVKWWENRGPVSVGDAPGLPVRIELGQNFPNPFTDYTTIEFSCIRVGEASGVRLTVLDVSGRRIDTLMPEASLNGSFRVTWDGIGSDGNPASAGVYLYELRDDSHRLGGRMILVR